MAALRLRNIFGAILFLIGLYVLYRMEATQGFGDHPTNSYYGEALGGAFVLYYVIKFLFKIKNASILLLGVTFLVSSITTFVSKAQMAAAEEKKASAEIVKVFEAFQRGEKIPIEYGSSPLILLKNHLAKRQTILLEYAEKRKHLDMPSLLKPETLADVKRAKSALVKVNGFFPNLTQCQNLLLTELDQFEASALQGNDPISRSLYTEHLKTKEQTIQSMERVFQNQTNMSRIFWNWRLIPKEESNSRPECYYSKINIA